MTNEKEINKIIDRYYDEEINKSEFVSEFSKYFYNVEFVEFCQRNIEFGSVENLKQAVKAYKKINEIEVAVRKVLS